MGFIEVCHYHLRKPVKETLSKGQMDGAAWITLSLTGLSELTSGMVDSGGVLARRLAACWPDIMKWAKAIMLEDHVDGPFEPSTFFESIGPIFNTIHLVSTSALEEKDVYDLAVDLWKGKEMSGINYHTELPLFECMLPDSTLHVDRLLERSGYQDIQVVEKIVERMKCASIAKSSQANAKIFMVSVGMLHALIESRPHPISTAVLCSEAPNAVSSNLGRLVVDNDDSPIYQSAIFAALSFLQVFIQYNPHNATEMMENGLLFNILKTASIRPYRVQKKSRALVWKICFPPLLTTT